MINEDYKPLAEKQLKVLLKNPHYQKYYEKKLEILSKYPPQKERTREEHTAFMKEVGELIWEQDGDFQKYVWESMSEQDKIIQERTARGRKRKRDQF